MNVKTMTRRGLVEAISRNTNMNYKVSQELLDSILNYMIQAIVRDHKLKLTYFGSFEILDKKERVGRNPKTGEPKNVSARKVTSFTASEALKKQVLIKI